MQTRIDHFMYAVPSLDEGMQWATDTFGVAPAYGGEHIGLGTRNALLSLGSAYLEIIAPDPAQDLSGTLGERFANLSTGGLVTWAVEGPLSDIAAALKTQNIETHGPNRTKRQTAEGDTLEWELLFPVGSMHGSRLPFFIDWLACANPKDTNPQAGFFKALTLTTPESANLTVALAAIDLTQQVTQGDPAIAVTIATDSGELTLSSTPETITLRMT